MIPKVTTPAFPASPFSPGSVRPGDSRSSTFQSLLENRMADVPPVEGLVLSLLVEIINKIMSNPEAEAPLFYPPPALPGGLEAQRPVIPPQPPNPALFEEYPSRRPCPEGERQEIDRKIQETASRYGVEADLIRAVIEVESSFDPQAVSPAGARGLMQLMPATSADLGVRNPFDPGQNIEGGTRYLKQLLERYGGNRRLALAAYNWGMGNLEKRPEALPLETRRYLVKVEKAYERYAGEDRTRGGARV